MIEVSVVIPTRDRAADLAICLQSLAAQTYPRERFEVLVCDDGSATPHDELIAAMKNQFSALTYLRQTPKGPAAARNLGIRHAQGHIIALTDSDTLPDREWLTQLVAAFSSADIVGVEGRVFANNEGAFGSLGEGPSNLTGGVYLTCNCAYLKAALIAAGGFDETFPYAAYEDTEIAARIRQQGRIVFAPNAVVIHPQRRLAIATVFKKLRHWQYALLIALRYGYIAWPQYPTRFPVLKVAVLATLWLPLAKLKHAVRHPRDAAHWLLIALLESLGACVIVLPMLLSGSYKRLVSRQRYLD